MLYAIIAAGEGSRLSNEGYMGLKPMVTVHGEMLIDRLIRIFIQNDAEAISVIINENSPELAAHLQGLRLSVPLHIITKTTESSLHSFYELLAQSGKAEELCLTTTDTVFDKEEFRIFINAFKENRTNDGLLAVTSFVDDESPLYVSFNENLEIEHITDNQLDEKPFVSGGIYCLRKKGLEVVSMAVNGGVNRMRNFQRLMLENGVKLNAHPFSKIMDIDHISDIDKAEYFLNEIEA
jgi:NDP-sugar pyrophosphorylase family protein